MMARATWGWLGLLVLATAAAAPAPAEAQAGARAQAQDGMPNFRSDEELRRFLMPDPEEGLAIAVPPPPPPPSPPPPPPPPPSPPPAGAAPPPVASAPAAAAPSVVVTGSAAAAPDNPGITNVQVAGVDEGGIVKVIGEHLVILRRGRLFTVSTAGGGLIPVDAVQAYPPGADAGGDWYDEMLVSGDLIVVVGYSYERGGTEINRFRMSPDGRLRFVDSHHLKSDDYYSSRNFASRLIGQQLVVYSPLYFDRWPEGDPLDSLPGLSRWQEGQEEPEWRRIASGREVYMPAPMRASGPGSVEAMHTVSRCDLTAPELSCQATVVLGPSGRTFFVSQNAVYVWVHHAWGWGGAPEGNPYLYRIPLDGGRPSAVQVSGSPVDQFSFHANTAASRLDVLVTEVGGGDAMWAPEFAAGQPALLSLPTSRFGDGSRAAPPSDYRPLPGGDFISITRNRFVGDWLLYGLRPQISSDARAQLVVAPIEPGSPVIFDMPGGVDRIEQIGRDALVVGSADGAAFTTIDLSSGRLPFLGDRFLEPGARESESRSHAFFYRADSADGADGLAGLPILRNVQAGGRWTQAAEMLFLRRSQRRLADYGRLAAGGASPNPRPDDGCVASCVDWYGNARPIFLGGRVFALMGYELVEGDASGERIRETRRVDFTPGAAGAEPKTPQPEDAPAGGK